MKKTFVYFQIPSWAVFLSLLIFSLNNQALAGTNSAIERTLKITNAQFNQLKNRLEAKNIPGGIALVKVDQATNEVYFDDQPLLIIENQVGGKYALVGLGLGLEPSRYLLSSNTRPVSFLVSAHHYKEQRIQLAQSQQKYITPAEETITRIQQEREQANAMINSIKEFLPKSLNFIKPTQGVLTSPFGLRRFFNDIPRSPHNGIDFANQEGTDIFASASGEVIDIHDYYYNGKTIFINHGANLVTVYIHLSETMVDIGDFVEQGEVIAKMGETGRTTAPNLHFGIYLNGNAIDPSLLMTDD